MEERFVARRTHRLSSRLNTTEQGRGSPKPPLPDLVLKEHVHGVGESGQGGVDHQLVLILVCDQIEDEVEGVLVDG